MKKIQLLCLSFLIIITCTGCSVEYNINITKNNVEEEINVTDYISSNRTKNDILKHYNKWYPTFVNYATYGEAIGLEDFNQKIDGIEYHSKSIKQFSNRYEYTYNYTYDIDDYYDSYVLASTYFETTIQKRISNLVIRTSKDNFLCQYDYFETAKINITIDPDVYKLKYTNAEDVNNNTYTWTLNRNNCEDSEIILTLDTINNNNQTNSVDNNKPSTDNNDNNESNTNSTNSYEIYILFAIIAILILIGYIWFKKLKEKNNGID